MSTEYERDKAWLLAEKFGGVETPEFFGDLERLYAGEPLAYLIGHIPFLGATIHLDSHPLIPRVETEYWVEKAIEEIKRGAQSPRVLDLCAGSGCVGVAVLKHIPEARVDFCEIDARHHTTIKKNLLSNASESTLHIFGGNLFAEIPEDAQYDFILSNPPYIDPLRADRTDSSVKTYEPHHALFGGEGGMDIIKSILEGAPAYLTHGGVLYLEHEPEQSADIRSLWLGSAETLKDQYGVERYTRLMRE